MRRSYRAYTKAFKQRIYLAAQSPATDGAELDWIGSVLARHAIDARRCDSLLAAERFSITNYVHPPLALADTTLKAIFQPQTPVQYLYKTYPEGPLCRGYRRYARTVGGLQKAAQPSRRRRDQPAALLNDDSYPVPSRMVSRRWIDHFRSSRRRNNAMRCLRAIPRCWSILFRTGRAGSLL